MLGFLVLNWQASVYAADGETVPPGSVVVSGGQQVIHSHEINEAGSLSVSPGATAIIDFGQSAILNIVGNIDNSGSIYAVSSNPAIQSISINGLNITNNSGALLTTIVPVEGLAGISGIVGNLSMSLNAVNNILNSGTISSAANLAMNAGNLVDNHGVVNAVQNINIVTGVAGLVNDGIIASAAANLNISSLASQNLLVTNTNGTLQALLGDINLSTLASGSLDKLNLSLIGGDVLSNELNIITQEGVANIDTQDLSGLLNVTAGEVHVTARTENLRLGSMNITGDPTFWNPTAGIQINGDLIFAAQNLAIIAAGDITTTGAGPWNISTSTPLTAGSILMIAGANMTPAAGGTGGTAPGTPDTATALTISGASGTGGNIDLTQGGGISSLNTSSTGNGQGGSVTLIAYGGAGKGSVLLPTSATISTGTATNNNFTTNGNVTIIAGATSGQAVSIGNINATGNTVSPSINNGLVNIFSATPTMFQAVNQQNAPTAYTGLLGNQLATQQYIIVTDATNIAAGQTLTLNPTGANPEQVVVAPSYTTGTTIPLTTALKFNHGSSENVTLAVGSVTTAPGAGLAGSPIISNGGMFAAGALQQGNITVGSISTGGNVVIGTAANSPTGSGVVTLNGSITLSQNPTATANFNDTPVVQITGQQINVPSASTTLSSAISGCSFCQDVLNIYTQNLSNQGTVSGTFVNIQNPITSTLTVSNSGTISGVNPGSVAGNPWVNIQSAGGISFNSNGGAMGTVSVPNWALISVSAADTNSIAINNNYNFQGGVGSVVTFSAQGAGASLNIAQNAALVTSPVTTGFGAPLLSISTPTLNFADGSSIQGSQSSMIFTSGALVQSPQPLTLSVASGGSAQIISGQTNNVVFRPTDGQNIHFTSPGSGASLAFSSGPVYLYTGTNSAGTAGQIVIDTANISVTAPSSFSAVDPNGGIKGIAFQPYVGPATNFPSNFTLFGTYTYPQVVLLMGPIAMTGLFQNLGTYTQGAFIGAGGLDPTQKSSYVISGSAQYVIQAAKQMGFQVTAGAYSENLNKTVNVPPTEAEIDFALQQAVKYGNVMDMVVGNECIIADNSGNIATSINSLVTAINYAQTQRTSLGFNASTLPITTRQTYGALSGVTSTSNDIAPQTINLLNGCTNCYSITTYTGVDGHVYADVYPYYDGTNGDGSVAANSIASYLVPGGVGSTTRTNISQSDFQTLVTAANTPPAPPAPVPAPPPIVVGIQADLNGTIAAFQTAHITPKLRVAETGWATASTQSSNTQTSALPNNAPQANPQWAGWYYPDMQSWSYSNKSSNALNYQIPISGYFEAYDEPWKYTATTWQGGEPNFGIWTATGTNQAASNPTPAAQFQLTGIAQKFNLPTFNLSNTAPLSKPSGATVAAAALPPVPTPAPTLNLTTFNSALINVGASLSESRGTIIPTDINPEVNAANSAQSANPAALTNIAGMAGAAPINPNASSFNQSQLGTNPLGSFLTFSGGNMLLSPDHNVTVATDLAQVEVDAGASVLLIQTGGELAVIALHDDYSGAVRVKVDGQSLEIPVGRQVVLSKDHAGKFDSLNPSAIGYRNLSDGKVGTLKAFMSEISLPTALSTTKSIRQLLKSAEKEERELAAKLLKTAAAAMVSGKKNIPFKASR